MIISPLRAFMATPFTSMLTNSSAIAHSRKVRGICGRDDAAATVVNHVFKFVPIVLHEALHRPRRCIPQRADGMAFDAVGDIDEEIEVLAAGSAAENSLEQTI